MQCFVCKKDLQGNQRSYCSNACKQKAHYDKVKEQPNTYSSQTKRALQRKMHFIEKAGGSCSKCGYNQNISALHFHHKDSNTKIFALDARNLSNNAMNTLEKEFSKCVLLCANCHAEEHYVELDKNNVYNIIGDYEPKDSYANRMNSGKPKTNSTSKLSSYTLDDIKELFSQYKTYVKVAEKIGMSDTGLRKQLAKKFNLDKAILSQALGTLNEGAETSGEVKSS
jgi:DNA-directed RNA polymerase subunit M/transcription elongation factor TFIIS